MGETYFDILSKLDYELGGVCIGWADVSSDKDNLYDVQRTEINSGHFDRGRIYIARTGDGLAPKGEIKVIKSSGNTKGHYLPVSSFTADIDSGDTYWIVPGHYTFDDLKISINRVLDGLKVPEEDETSLTYDAEVKRYTLPASIPDPDSLLQVHLQYSTSPKDWVEHTNFHTQEAGYLFIEGVRSPSDYDGKPILLVYESTPSSLANFTDDLHKKIHQDIVIFGAAKRIIFTNLRRAGNDATTDTRYIHFADQERLALKRHKINMPERPMQSSGYGI